MGFLSTLFGSSKSRPATTTNVISQKLPEEIAPFAKEVLEDARELYRANLELGYDPYTGKTIAPFMPEEEQAMTGISGLVGTSRPLQEEALETYRRGGDQFTAEVAEQFMSPYQQAVTDVEKREAQRQFEGTTLPRLEKQAIDMGAMSGLGSRAGIEMAEAQRNQNRLLADIQARGQQKAYEDARKGFEAQKQRERQMAGDVGAMGPAMIATGLQEQGALQSVGEQKRELGQATLDDAYYRFLEEQQFPQQQLANYSGFVYGNPAAGMISQSEAGTKSAYQPSFGQNIMGIGSMLGSAALRNPNFFASGVGKGIFGKTGGGLSSLIEKQNGSQVGTNNLEDLEQYYPGVTGEASLENIKSFLSSLGKFASRNAPVVAEPPEGKYYGPEGELLDINVNLLEDLKLKPEMQRRVRQAGGEDLAGLPGDLEEGAVVEVKEEVTPQKQTKKVLQSLAGPSTPKALTNKQSAALDEEEAGRKYDSNPAAFGDLTRKQYLADTKAQNEKYLAFVNKLYPEGQNEFLADALAALGSMFIAENKGAAFEKKFSELQAAGMKRRDARRAAIGKVGLENLKRDDATLEKIRMLPKKRREAIEKILAKKYAAEKRDLEKDYKKAMTKKAIAEAGKAERYRPKGEKPKASKIFPTAVKEDLVKFMTADSGGLLDIATSQLSKPGVAEKFAKEQGIQANDIGSLTEYVKKAFKDKAIQQDALSEAGKIFAKGDISEQDAVIRGMFTVLKKYKYKPETGFLWFGDSEKFERTR